MAISAPPAPAIVSARGHRFKSRTARQRAGAGADVQRCADAGPGSGAGIAPGADDGSEAIAGLLDGLEIREPGVAR